MHGMKEPFSIWKFCVGGSDYWVMCIKRYVHGEVYILHMRVFPLTGLDRLPKLLLCCCVRVCVCVCGV